MATENPVKTKAVQTAFSQAFADQPVHVEALALCLGLPEQPLDDAIAAGAMKRATAAQQHSRADFGVGIEAGLMKLPGTSRLVSIQICAIVDAQGRGSMGLGPGYELPQPLRDAVLAGEPLRHAFERLLGQTDPKRLGAVYYLSNGQIDRTELTIQGIRMAIIPWLS